MYKARLDEECQLDTNVSRTKNSDKAFLLSNIIGFQMVFCRVQFQKQLLRFMALKNSR